MKGPISVAALVVSIALAAPAAAGSAIKIDNFGRGRSDSGRGPTEW
jgi:hypothetical protein